MNLQKGQSDGGGPAASSMIKSAKSTEGKKKEVRTIRVLDLLLGLQRKSKDYEKDYYKNKTQKPINTKKPSLVSVTISLKQIRRLPGAWRNHFDVCFPGYNGGQAVPQHLDTAPTN